MSRSSHWAGMLVALAFFHIVSRGTVLCSSQHPDYPEGSSLEEHALYVRVSPPVLVLSVVALSAGLYADSFPLGWF